MAIHVEAKECQGGVSDLSHDIHVQLQVLGKLERYCEDQTWPVSVRKDDAHKLMCACGPTSGSKASVKIKGFSALLNLQKHEAKSWCQNLSFSSQNPVLKNADGK